MPSRLCCPILSGGNSLVGEKDSIIPGVRAHHSGPPLTGIPLSRSPLAGPPLAGPPLSRSPLAGPPLTGTHHSWPPLSGTHHSWPPLTGTPLTGAGAPLAGARAVGVPIAVCSPASGRVHRVWSLRWIRRCWYRCRGGKKSRLGGGAATGPAENDGGPEQQDCQAGGGELSCGEHGVSPLLECVGDLLGWTHI